jgi:hypothetical protein
MAFFAQNKILLLARELLLACVVGNRYVLNPSHKSAVNVL